MSLISKCLILSLMEPFFSWKSKHLPMPSSDMKVTVTVEVSLAI